MKSVHSQDTDTEAAASRRFAERTEAILAKLRALLEGDAEEQCTTFRNLRRALEHDRAGARSPFDPES
jgi:hypothetical protein